MVQTPLLTDLWVTTTWKKYLQTIEDPACEKAKGYYYNSQMRIEMLPVGPSHADDNGILAILINLTGVVQGIPLKVLVNCSYRKVGIRECQPDLSYYVGDRARLAPQGNAIVNLDITPPPNLAIEIAATSLAG